MKSSICLVNKKQCASFRIACHMLAIAPLWLMLAAANTPADAQTSNDETVLGANNVGSLHLKWANPIAGGSSPTVVKGVVYFGAGDGNVYALNASTGARLWNYPTGGGSPTIVNGVVYVVSYDAMFQVSIVYALKANTGAKVWSHVAGVLLNGSFAVANDAVYVTSLDSGFIFALNASTGALLWSYDTTAIDLTPPVVANGVVYFGTDINSVFALNASTGAVLWSYETGGEVHSALAVANGVVYVADSYTTNDHLYALNASTGALLWSYAPGGGSLTIVNGVVYIGSGNLGALNASTGAKLWSFATGGGSPTVVNGVIYIGAGDGNVYALNASTGAKLWSYAVVGAGSPAVANGVVYFGAGDGNAYALNASTGAKLWSYATGGGSPVVANGVVYINGGSNVYAFSVGADLFLRIFPSTTTVHHGDLLTFAFPVWNLGPDVAEGEVLSSLQVPAGTTFDYLRISGTPGLGKCTHPPYGGTGQIFCHEGDGMAPNTTWTVRLTVKVTAAAGSTITSNAATMSDTLDPNLANNTATVSVKVQ